MTKQGQMLACRGHTEMASAAHMEAGGNEWDTVKPLHKWFKHLDRVLLIDDVADKAGLPCVHAALDLLIITMQRAASMLKGLSSQLGRVSIQQMVP